MRGGEVALRPGLDGVGERGGEKRGDGESEDEARSPVDGFAFEDCRDDGKPQRGEANLE